MKSLVLAKNILVSNFRRSAFPYKLTFVATYRCQSRCVYCKIWEREPEGELTLEQIQAFFKKSNKFSWVDVTGGEVTLRSDYPEIARSIIANNRDLYHLHTPTNGLAPERIERQVREILGMKPNKFVVTVSLDGPKDLNDKLRGIEGDFAKVIDTVKRLRSIKQSNFQVVIGFTLSSANKGTFTQMIDQVQAEIPDMSPDDFHMNVVHVSGHYYDNVNTDALAEDLRGDVRKYRAMRRHKFTPVGFLEDQYLRLADQYLETGKTPIVCQALAGSVFIDSFGYIYPCSIYSKRMANIKDIDYDLEAYWNTKEVREARGEIEHGQCPQCWTPCEAYQSILGKLHTVRLN
ncbi:MAG TPA: radical SAM protein [Opitutaceae bacterium]